MAKRKDEMVLFTYRALVTLFPQISLFEYSHISQTENLTEREQKHKKMEALYNGLLDNRKLIYIIGARYSDTTW